jgi:Zn-dependent alcohol dehydrogenase
VVRAAVLPAPGADLTVADIALPGPAPGQVRIRIAAAGVCHSDLSLATGALRQPTPAVLGHEAAGTVLAAGEGVTGLTPGQPVVINWAPPCRACWFCEHGQPYLCEHAQDTAASPYATLEDGTPVYPGLGTGAFAEETVVPASAAIPLPDGFPPEEAALLGCAVLTGVGAVRRHAQVPAGASAVVLGLGGVGLCAVQGLRLAGAAPIIAVDVAAGKEPLARRLGATEFLPADDQLARQVRRSTGGRGADFAFDCVGSAATIRQAWSLTRRGGHATVIGIGPKDATVTFNALELFHFARTLSGCVYGDTDPERDIPPLLDDVRAGRLDLAGLVSDQVGLDGIPAAFDAMRQGRVGRTVVRP